ncbi:MAG: 5-formyltetrahydrofolate cyclo-ligase [Candidatus Nitrosocaldaceae archaeon]
MGLRYKDSLRKIVLETRNMLSSNMLASLSDMIQYRIISLNEFNSADIIGAYYSIGSEVKTDKIIEYALKHKRLALPRVEGSIVFAQVKSMNELVKGRYNIMEPNEYSTIIEPDLVIVPGIVFDENGYRIGYGKGYYDRYLADRDIKKIGLAYDFQVFPYIQHEKHDIRLDKIVTDKRIIVIK